jgi:hypothetical protein
MVERSVSGLVAAADRAVMAARGSRMVRAAGRLAKRSGGSRTRASPSTPT